MATDGIRVIQYYKFVPVEDPQAVASWQRHLCASLGLLGRIYVAPEGINGTLAGPAPAVEAYQAATAQDERFAGILYKEHTETWVPFRKLSVQVKPEIVALKHTGFPPPYQQTGAFVGSQEFRQLLENPTDDVVVLDARSRYEHELGRFRGALTLPIENFRDLPNHLPELEKLRHKTIVTYCTGGVKCEKLTAWLLEEGFADVRQLHGGILHYAAETGGAGFEGRCYVFDDRVAVDVNTVDPTPAAQCPQCGQPADFPMNCANVLCHKRVTLCKPCAERLQGCCTPHCHTHGQRREWKGTGRFVRGDKPLAGA
jgi:UPF0176 protein